MDLSPATLKRYGSVARLLVKYGRSGLVKPDEPLADAEESPSDNRGEELAQDLEALGPTFIKLGQLLSSRGALIPPEYSSALERLQDSVEPIPLEDVERIITEELGVRISKAFETFESKPLASASLGQVHRARLRDGREVVVKVQRPNIRQRIREDLDAFDEMARLLEKHTKVGPRLELPGLVEEFRKTIFAELDYNREAENLEQLADELAGFPRIVVPHPVNDYTTSRVLTMDYIPGRKVTRTSPLTPLEVDGNELAEELFQAYLHQILVAGFFHADPHAGNVLLTPDNRIALIDLGMVARISQRMQETLLKMVLAITDGRGEETADLALAFSEQVEDVDTREFRLRVARLVGEYGGKGIALLPVGRVFMDIVRIAVETNVRVPAEMALLGKTLYSLEAVGHALAPEFNPSDAVRRYAAQLLRARMIRSVSLSNVFGSLLELRDFAERLPGRLNRILDTVANNRLGLKVDTGIDASGLMLSAQKIANRITLGLVLAALIVGAALLMRVDTTFRLFGYPGFAILLFLLAAGAGVLLLLSIVAKDRR